MGRCQGEPLSWAYITSTDDGVTPPNSSNSANASGVAFSTAGTADTDGTAVTVLSALAHDVHRLVLLIGGISINAGIGCALGDLLADPAGGTSWASIIDDIVMGHTPVPSGGVGCHQVVLDIPLYIKAGTSLGFRAKCHNASSITDGRIKAYAFGEPSNPDAWWCGEKVETLGNGANSNGTLITPGNTGAFGSWTNVGSTTTYRYGAIALAVQGDNSATLNAVGYQFEIGVGSAKIPGLPPIYVAQTASETIVRSCGLNGWFFGCDIAAGTQMQVRATQTGSAGNTPGVCLYGVAR